jgi:hypothetical protein
MRSDELDRDSGSAWTPSGRLPAPRLPIQRDRIGNQAAILGIVLVLVAR